MAFKGITFAGQNVTPKNDGALYNAHYGDGILDGCTMTISGDDLVIASGHFIAGGRVCHVDGATNVDLSGRGLTTGYIQVIMNYDLSQGEGSQWYTSFVESASTTFPALTQDDINGTGTLYQLQLAIIQISGGNLTNITGSLGSSSIYVYDETGIRRVTVYATSVTGGLVILNDDGTNRAGFIVTSGGSIAINGTGGNINFNPTGEGNSGAYINNAGSLVADGALIAGGTLTVQGNSTLVGSLNVGGTFTNGNTVQQSQRTSSTSITGSTWVQGQSLSLSKGVWQVESVVGLLGSANNTYDIVLGAGTSDSSARHSGTFGVSNKFVHQSGVFQIGSTTTVSQYIYLNATLNSNYASIKAMRLA